MGFHTVAHISNDFLHELQTSPQTVVWLLRNPGQYGYQNALELSILFTEPTIHPQALKVFSPHHASYTHYYRSGQNMCHDLEYVKDITVKGKKCVVLQLPDFMQDKGVKDC